MKFEDVKVGQPVKFYINTLGRESIFIVAFKNPTTGKIVLLQITQERNHGQTPSMDKPFTPPLLYQTYYLTNPIEVYASELIDQIRFDCPVKFIVNNKVEFDFYKSKGYYIDEPSQYPCYFGGSLPRIITKAQYESSLDLPITINDNTIVLDQYAPGRIKIGTDFIKTDLL